MKPDIPLRVSAVMHGQVLRPTGASEFHGQLDYSVDAEGVTHVHCGPHRHAVLNPALARCLRCMANGHRRQCDDCPEAPPSI